MSHPEPVVLFIGLGESSIDFELRCFLADVNTVVSVKSELLLEIYTNLGQAGIEIPFPQRDITVRNVDAIAEAVASMVTGRANSRPAPG
jgi:small-conductance mechanosensitive channel